jgi:phage baseplate assembly protein W
MFMATFQIKIPIEQSSELGFKHIKTVQSSIWQDLRNLLYTIPGEKINDQDFGIGIQTYLFEQDSDLLKQELAINIKEKISKYLPFIVLEDISFTSQDNTLYIQIKYYIGSSVNLEQVTLKLNSALD